MNASAIMLLKVMLNFDHLSRFMDAVSGLALVLPYFSDHRAHMTKIAVSVNIFWRVNFYTYSARDYKAHLHV